ncbi:hypothetical protein AB0M91_23665 [Micromonospora rifamycinica]|uniref:hypothetical protein n=1 Tax=Micromonospora rifamycinica TaxID=291594 RepID=UPI0034277126
MIRRLLARVRPPARIHYRHQTGVCPAGHCPGHTTRADRCGLARIDALRAAGHLAYVGPGRAPAWLTRLTRR